MLKITIKYKNDKEDFEFDKNQEIKKVLEEVIKFKKWEIDLNKVNAIKVLLDNRVIDIYNTFSSLEIKNNEILELLE